MQKRLMFVLSMLLVSTSISLGTDLSKSVVKKIDKSISREFKGEDISRVPVVLTDSQKIEFQNKVKSIFRLKKGDENIGFLVLASSMGRIETFDFLVIYDTLFTVRSIDLIKYNSNYGMEIGSRKWLKQYSGYSGGELKYGKDIQTISGATISANALTRDIQILTGILKQMEF